MAAQLDVEGFIVAGARNPSFDVSEKLLMQISRLSRALALTGMPVDKVTLTNAQKAEQEAAVSRNIAQKMSLFAL